MVFAFDAGFGMFDAALLLGFFHRTLGFFGALGADLGTFLALLIENLLAAASASIGQVEEALTRIEPLRTSHAIA